MATPQRFDRRYRVALIGTSGSGKSTLVNLLVGRLLLPMSTNAACSTIYNVHHRWGRTVLRKASSGSRLQLGGDQDVAIDAGAVDGEIRKRLVESQQAAVSPQQVVTLELPMIVGSVPVVYPLWWRRRLESVSGNAFAALPSVMGDRFAVRKLPGYRSAGDQEMLDSMTVGLQDCDRTIVVFNAEETDSKKEEQLVSGVVRKVITTENGIESLLWVVNRADVFRRDRAPSVQLKRRKEKLGRMIGDCLSDARFSKRYEPNIVELSSLAALAGEVLYWNERSVDPGDRHYLLEQAAHFSGILLPKQAQAAIPRDPAEWGLPIIRLYRNAMMQASNYLEFFRCLRTRYRPIESARRRPRRQVLCSEAG